MYLHIAIGHKSEQLLKVVEIVQTQRFVYFFVLVPSDDLIFWSNKNISACVRSGIKRQLSVLAFDILEGEKGNVTLSLPAVRNSVY